MSIPQNITKEDLIKGAEKIIKEGIPSTGHSTYYDVFYRNYFLPPKVIVSYANLFKNGQILDRSSFEGGLNTECFRLLEDNGFEIVHKDNIYPTLLKFVNQAKSTDLKTSNFHKKIKGLKCKISFGQGSQAKIPWISFLKAPNTTSKGIYPVFLLYKSIGKLILAYGISETQKPEGSWKIQYSKTISDYFYENNLGKPDRYGTSFIFKVYDIKNLPSAEVLDNDLNELIQTYLNSTKETVVLPKETVMFDRQNFIKSLSDSGLILNPKLITRFISSLLTKPFVILSGLSGSGKTKLAQAFAHWICQYDNQYCIVPVGADWTNREPLLGYPNALNTDQ